MENWIVERRFKTPETTRYYDFEVMHIASSQENAVAYCERSVQKHKRDHVWWWAIYPMTVDASEVQEKEDYNNNILLFSWDAKRIGAQPIAGYETK